jgi:peptidoglycan/xylan/chitin deacetylase (PgdA/CDA1 family)
VNQRLAAGMYRSGGLSMMRAFARKWELAQSPQRIRPSGPKYAVICYHTVGNTGVPFFCGLTGELFERQIAYLVKHYRVVSLGEMLAELKAGIKLPPAVVLTFDDGYRGVYTHAYPVMKKYGVTATVFLTGNSIEHGEVAWYDRIFSSLIHDRRTEIHFDGSSHALSGPADRIQVSAQLVKYLRAKSDRERLEFCEALERESPALPEELVNRVMTWDEVIEMQRAGFQFGCHTMTHPVAARLTREQFAAEISECKRLVETRLGTACVDFAFPFGKRDECTSAEVLVQRGFRSAMTTEYGINGPGTSPFELRRVSSGDMPSLDLFAFDLARAMVHGAESSALGLPELRGTEREKVRA